MLKIRQDSCTPRAQEVWQTDHSDLLYHEQKFCTTIYSMAQYLQNTMIICLVAVRIVLHCKNVSKGQKNTCSQDMYIFFRQELRKKYQCSHLDFSLLCTKRTLFSFTSLKLKWSPLLSCTSFPFTTITSLPLEGVLSIWNKSSPASPSRSCTPSKERSRGFTLPIPTVKVLFTWKLEGCLLAKKTTKTNMKKPHLENHVHSHFMKEHVGEKLAANFQQPTQNCTKLSSKLATEWTLLLALKSAGSLPA